MRVYLHTCLVIVCGLVSASAVPAQTTWTLDFEGWDNTTFDSNFVQMANLSTADLAQTAYARSIVADPDAVTGDVLRITFTPATAGTGDQYGMFVLSTAGMANLSYPANTFDGVTNSFRVYYDLRQSTFSDFRDKVTSMIVCVADDAHSDPAGNGGLFAVLQSDWNGTSPGQWGGFFLQSESDSSSGGLQGAKAKIDVSPEPLLDDPFELTDHWYRCRMDLTYLGSSQFSVQLRTWDRDTGSEASPLAVVDFVNPLTGVDIANRLGDRMALGLFVNSYSGTQPPSFHIWLDRIAFTTGTSDPFAPAEPTETPEPTATPGAGIGDWQLYP